MASREHMREYETIYVMRPELDDSAAKDFMLGKKELIEKLGGKNLKVTAMGRKKLAWECQKQTRGIYVHHHFLGKPGIVKDFDLALSLDDNVLIRHSVVLKSDVDPSLAKVEEDVLTPPVFKEKREFSDRRPGRFNSEYEGRRGRDYDSDNYDDSSSDDDDDN
ncbi:MAG: 30S ribosomal protein S6 [Myxococcales bacterium]|nr:30S ribosomal protein S6 [Myxococcales bacterium]USN50102.1 MAG: 30S ribosomal protein S6 [Myxococcales bacterium]